MTILLNNCLPTKTFNARIILPKSAVASENVKRHCNTSDFVFGSSLLGSKNYRNLLIFS